MAPVVFPLMSGYPNGMAPVVSTDKDITILTLACHFACVLCHLCLIILLMSCSGAVVSSCGFFLWFLPGHIHAVIHYLANYFLCYPSFPMCHSALSSIIALFDHLGVPLALEKVKGPASTFTFLGIEIDDP